MNLPADPNAMITHLTNEVAEQARKTALGVGVVATLTGQLKAAEEKIAALEAELKALKPPEPDPASSPPPKPAPVPAPAEATKAEQPNAKQAA